MNLGQSLKNTLDTLSAQNLRESEARDAEALRKIKRERQKLEKLVEKIRQHIETKIKEGAVPSKKVDDYSDQSWIRSAAKGDAKHNDIWNEFTAWLGANGLALDLREDHDGVGIKSWITVRVKPL